MALLDPKLLPMADSIVVLLNAATANVPSAVRASVWYIAARRVVEACAAAPPQPAAVRLL